MYVLMIFVNFGVELRIISGAGSIRGFRAFPHPGVEHFLGSLISGVPKSECEMFSYEEKRNIFVRKEILLFANAFIDDMMGRENVLQ